MRYLKLALISVFVLFALLTAISLLIPSTIVISRSVTIKRNPAAILPLVNNLRNWPSWIHDHDTTPVAMKATQAGMSPRLMIGQTMVQLISADSAEVKTTWRTNKGRSMDASFYVLPREDGSSMLQWRFIQKLRWYPWEKFSSVATEKVLGPYMEHKLNQLKLVAENAT
ncbi:hypothetical protein EXU57_06165 [Segetibacter sp. 3557_3]|uniref:SRPBCC family protein n=1 Tax=Segetibacter sp. 3557_3 TaxID=2547429 RepID=UPI00105882ED|nr:SRPBCC family protein [Segetibacter sp. 3557_3]TDH28046.1 hypothetical protein EXU57_06165 [Segetibacter sp. 3557_3]